MQTDQKRATARTIIPALIGVLLAQLIAKVPALDAALAWADGVLAETAESVGLPAGQFTAVAILNAVLAALVVWAWYQLAKFLGDRWPSVERWMLGSAERPQYATTAPAFSGMLDAPGSDSGAEVFAEPIESEGVSVEVDWVHGAHAG